MFKSLCIVFLAAFVAVNQAASTANIDNGNIVAQELKATDPGKLIPQLCSALCGYIKSGCVDIPGANKCSTDFADCSQHCTFVDSCDKTCETKCKAEYNCQNPTAESIDDLECDGDFQTCADGCAMECHGKLASKMAVTMGKALYKQAMGFYKTISS